MKFSSPHYPPPTRRCEEAGKLCYESQHHARTARKRLKETMGGEDLNIYQCKACHLWHVGNNQ